MLRLFVMRVGVDCFEKARKMIPFYKGSDGLIVNHLQRIAW